MGRDHRIPGGYRLNWTNVGLKSPGDPLVGAEGPGLNWTNVGLK